MGVIVLKRLDQAIESGDNILAVISGTSVNHGGRSPSGLTVPNQDAQVELITDAIRVSGISPRDIHFFEAHGTGTSVGDPIEANAIGSVLSKNRPQDQPVLIGSVKSNIGHLEPAAGIAGVAKACLMLERGQIFPNLHFVTPNPSIQWERYNMRVPVENEPWTGPPYAAVNSFGIGGTNSCIVLKKFEETQDPTMFDTATVALSLLQRDDAELVLAISARSTAALKALSGHYASVIRKLSSRKDVVRLCSVAATKRARLECRAVVIGRDVEELLQRLDKCADENVKLESIEGVVLGQVDKDTVIMNEGEKVCMVFSGQGAQYWGMARQMIEQKIEPFCSWISKIDGVFKPLSGWSIQDEIMCDEEESKLHRTDVVQPMILAVQMTLFET